LLDHSVSTHTRASATPALLEMAAADFCRLDAISRRLKPLGGTIAVREIHERLMSELLAAAAGAGTCRPLADVRDDLLGQAAVATRRWLRQAAKKERGDRVEPRGRRRQSPAREEALDDLVDDEAASGAWLCFHMRHRARCEAAPARIPARTGGRA